MMIMSMFRILLLFIFTQCNGFIIMSSFGPKCEITSNCKKSFVIALASALFVVNPAIANDYGVMKSEELVKNVGSICIKRSSINGRCEKYDNESTVFTLPKESEKVIQSKSPTVVGEPESELVRKLKQKTIENKAKNDAYVAEKSFLNSQSGEFGPFSRYVPVKRPSNGQYELVLIRELKGLQKQGIITPDGRSFVEGKEPIEIDE